MSDVFSVYFTGRFFGERRCHCQDRIVSSAQLTTAAVSRRVTLQEKDFCPSQTDGCVSLGSSFLVLFYQKWVFALIEKYRKVHPLIEFYTIVDMMRGSVFVAMIALVVIRVGGMCDNNAISYQGLYTVTWSGRSTVNSSNAAIRTDGFEAQFQIDAAPPSESGSQEYSYWVRRYVGEKNATTTDANVVASVSAAKEVGVDSICVAPPYPSAGLECVDVEDAGLTRLTPIEVDADCNLIKGWSTYLEAATPGCDGPLCYPVASIRTWTREGSDGAVDSVTLLPSGSTRHGAGSYILMVLCTATTISLLSCYY